MMRSEAVILFGIIFTCVSACGRSGSRGGGGGSGGGGSGGSGGGGSGGSTGACARLTFVSRAAWGGQPPRSTQLLSRTQQKGFVVHHTAGVECNSPSACNRAVAAIQRYHMDTKRWVDVGYNFLIGGDGRVYVGRGWNVRGAHTGNDANGWTIGVALLGNFVSKDPSYIMRNTLDDFIKCGAEKGEVELHAVGHEVCKGKGTTECPGLHLDKWLRSQSYYDSTVCS